MTSRILSAPAIFLLSFLASHAGSAGGNFLWSKCQDLGNSSIFFSHNSCLGRSLLPPNKK